jgi:hypothetical protein
MSCTSLCEEVVSFLSSYMTTFLTNNNTQSRQVIWLSTTLKSGPCKENGRGLREDINYNYKELLKVQSSFYQPLGYNVKFRSEKELLKASLACPEMPDQYISSTSSKMVHDVPTLMHCEFQNRKYDNCCGNFSRSFTTDGIGYSFNSANFFTIYNKSNPELNIFCQELVQLLDRDMCSTGEKMFTELWTWDQILPSI